jgi:hypothetical protein
MSGELPFIASVPLFYTLSWRLPPSIPSDRLRAHRASLDQFAIACTGKWRDLGYGTGSVSDLNIDHATT